MDPTQAAAATADDQLAAPPEAAPAPALNVLPNLLDDLRKMRSEIGANAKPIDIEIPGYRGRLVGRFRWVPVQELAATATSLRAIKDATRQQLAAAADALVATNEEILIRVEDKLESLQHEGVPVTFANGKGLCVALGLPAPRSARECVMSVFGNEYAMVDVATRIMTWLEDTSREVDEEHLGE